MTLSIQEILNRFWQQYYSENPAVKKLYDAFLQREPSIINDHIALRTFNDPRVNINILAQPFISNGYVESGEYDFPNKHLFAKHFEHADSDLPKLFISELISEKFSPALQKIVADCIEKIPTQILNDPEQLILSGVQWQPLSYATYQALLTESEYAAWMYAFGFRANHFTISVNHLTSFKNLEEVNLFAKALGFKLNDFDGEIKGTPEELLEQSSIRAVSVPVEFVDGTHEIPLCYYEFAQRYQDSNGKLYQGFIAASADKIFQSTDVKS